MKAYETLLSDLVPALDTADQVAIQRVLSLVSSCSSTTVAVADSSRSPPCLNMAKDLHTERPELIQIAAIPAEMADRQHLVSARWVQQVTWITMISSRQR